jgi:katanin p80 WD40 repeat-containing subunit B1
MYTDKNNSNIILTGSLDTNTKLWDLRSKNALNTYKSQNKKITALNIIPDSKILVIGS